MTPDPAPRRRGGRPRLPPEEKRRRVVAVWLTAAEHARLIEIAGRSDLGAWLRDAGLRRQPRVPRQVPAVNVEAWRSLARTAGHLSQLTAAIQTGRLRAAPELPALLEALRAEVAALRAELIGAAESDDADETLEASA